MFLSDPHNEPIINSTEIVDIFYRFPGWGLLTLCNHTRGYCKDYRSMGARNTYEIYFDLKNDKEARWEFLKKKDFEKAKTYLTTHLMGIFTYMHADSPDQLACSLNEHLQSGTISDSEKLRLLCIIFKNIYE